MSPSLGTSKNSPRREKTSGTLVAGVDGLGKASGGLVDGVCEGTSPISAGRRDGRDEFGGSPMVGEEVGQVGVGWAGR